MLRYFQFEVLHLRHRESLMASHARWWIKAKFYVQVQGITGEAVTVPAEIIKLGLAEGFFETPSPKGPLRVAFPAKIHEFYFPQLFLDLPEIELPKGPEF